MKKSALGIETRDHESKVTMEGSTDETLVNWVVLTHSICTAHKIPPQVLALAILSGVLDKVGECAKSMTVVDFGKFFRGGRQ